MAAKNKLLQEDYSFKNEDEIIAHEELVKELAQNAEEVWTHAIDEDYLDNLHANSSSSWVIEDNQDALAEYMDEVSDVILPEDIDKLDW